MTTPATSYLTPSDLRSAYRIPKATTDATVAIVTAGYTPAVIANLARYRDTFALGDCGAGCLRVVNQRGTDVPPALDADAGWASEADLDTQMVSAICPTCRILLVETDSNAVIDLIAGVKTAVALGARYVSMSWGAADTAANVALGDEVFATPGVVFVAAGGDYGYGVLWPSADSRVVSVGGTSLVPDPASARGWSETVWNDTAEATSATGSGCADNDPQPVWQQDIAAITATGCTGRASNDLAVVADPVTGVYTYNVGGWHASGGTSAGAPIIAAAYALANGPSPDTAVGPASSWPYLNSSAGGLVDITTGNDTLAGHPGCGSSLCTAGVGWDGPTGLGSLAGVAALRAPQDAVFSSREQPLTATLAPSSRPKLNGPAVLGGRVHVAHIAWHRYGRTARVVHPRVRCAWFLDRYKIATAGRCALRVPHAKRWAGARITVRVTAEAASYATYSVVTAARTVHR